MDQPTFAAYQERSRNTISAKVLADSVAPNGCRLTTFEWTYPRFIHSEIMTHRKLSKNSASSRAIPMKKMIERIQDNPVFPIHFGKNQKGMQANEELSLDQQLAAGGRWIQARDDAVYSAKWLDDIGIHKQIGNRILEPWMWITIICSATNFENMFALRCHPDAEPHFQNLAYKVREVFDASTPRALFWDDWHLPLFGFEGDEKIPFEDRPKVSVGRCARVSYLTHAGIRDPQEDIALYEKLTVSKPKHASPLEHVAKAVHPDRLQYAAKHLVDWGNFDPGWLQYRKMHENENVTVRE